MNKTSDAAVVRVWLMSAKSLKSRGSILKRKKPVR